jgi:hypothetical protein
MTTITDDILDMLDNDIVSHGLIAQCLRQADTDALQFEELIKETLKGLLASGNVEIGIPEMKTPDYLEFVAWKGTVDERVSRAVDAVANVSGPDKEFAYWLCLRENIDRFEGHDAGC